MKVEHKNAVRIAIGEKPISQPGKKSWSAKAIIIESGLSFLGFGVQPPTPSWGGMLQDAQSYLSDCPWIAVFPGLMIFLTVVCCNVLSDFLGEATNPARTVSR